MKYFEKSFFLILFVLILGGSGGIYYYAQNDQLRKDVDVRLSDLHQAKAGLDGAVASLTAAQKDLGNVNGRIHTFAEITAIRGQINKDQSDIQAYTSEILGDISFLQGQWALLSQAEKDFVAQAQQGLT